MKISKKIIIISLIFTFIHVNTSNATEPNLVGWWKFNEGEGSIAYDSAGNNHGIINGAIWTTGQINGALSFDGINDYVDVNDDPSLRFSQYDSFSISFWAKPISAGHVLTKMRASGQHGYLGYEILWSNSKFCFILEKSYSGRVSIYTPEGSAPAGDWYFVTAVYDNKKIEIYLNGEIGGSGTFNYDTGNTTPDKNLAIGARSYDSTLTSYFNGTIDDVRIYDCALSAEEILQLYLKVTSENAFSPYPADGAVSVDPDVVLSWWPGKYALSHDVYFGLDYNDVNNATPDSNEYMGNYDVNNYDPNGLELETTYYWRIDEVNGPNVWKGNAWSFGTWPAIGLSSNLARVPRL